MTDTLNNELSQHVQDCKSLQRDLRGLIDDLRFWTEDHGTIRYAVDTSEIYAYVFPEDNLEEMKTFREDDEKTLWTIQYSALNRLFFELPHKLILLEPHLLELAALVDRVRHEEFYATAAILAAALAEIDGMIRQPEFQSLLGLAERLEHSGRELEEDELWKVRTFFERHATQLIGLLEKADSEPQKRLKALLRAQRLEGIEKCLAEVPEIDQATVNRWYDQLRRLRRRSTDAASHLDAKAMATLKAANERLAAQSKTRICLVARSRHMHAAFDARDAHQGGETEAYILRHPRCFNMLRPIGGESEAARLERIQALEASVGAFLNAYAARPLGPSPEECSTDTSRFAAGDFRRSIADIQEKWRLNIGLSSSLGVMPAQPAAVSEAAHDPRARVRGLLGLITKQERLRDEIRARVVQLTDSMGRDYQVLGLEVYGQSPDQQRLLARNLRSRAESSVPYTLQFYSEELRQWAARVEREVDLWQEILQMFRTGIAAHSNYELLLFTAYLFGAWNRWQLAETYCDLALLTQQKWEQQGAQYVHPHEGLFFRAVCLRKHNPSAERFQKALHSLAEASESKAVALSDTDYEDPRFLKERATLIFQWHYMAKDANEPGQWDTTSLPPVDEAPSLWTRALELNQEGTELRIQIYNNLCFYYTEQCKHTPAQEYRNEALKYANALRSALATTAGEWTKWLPNYLDTLAWARWVLREKPTAPEVYREVIAYLDRALENAAPFPESEQATWSRHRIQIKEGA